MYFDVDAHRGCFKTNPNEAYFWHGLTDGCGGPENANNIAGKNGKTLERCMLDHRDELEKAGVRFKDNNDKTVSIDYGNTIGESKQFWEDCSKSFAEQASGNVHVIEGTDSRPNGQSEKDYPSVYNCVEYPALVQNQNVTSITHIDPATRQQTGVEVFNRQRSIFVSSRTGDETVFPSNPKQEGASVSVGARKEDLQAITSSQTSEQSPAGLQDPSQAIPVENSTVLQNLSGNRNPNMNPENEAVRAVTKAAGGMHNG